MNSNEHRLFVFHEKELKLILEKLGFVEKMNEGKLRCAVCGTVITADNFGAIFKKGNEIQVICDNLKCLEKARGR